MASQPQQGAGGGAQDPNPIGTWYNDVSHRTPVITRYVILALVSTYLISWFLPSLALALTNCPTSTIGGFEIYRLFLSPFIGTQLLSVIFGSLMIHQSGGRLERSKGSVKTLAAFMVITALAGLIYDAYTYAALALGADPLTALACSQGCWILVIGLIVIECEAAPDQERRLLFLPIGIPGKYFPWAILALFALFGGSLVEMLCGLAAGYLYAFERLTWLEPSQDRVHAAENLHLRWLSGRPGFVSLDAAGAEVALPTSSNQEAVRRERQQQGGGSSWVSPFGGAVQQGRGAQRSAQQPGPTAAGSQGQSGGHVLGSASSSSASSSSGAGQGITGGILSLFPGGGGGSSSSSSAGAGSEGGASSAASSAQRARREAALRAATARQQKIQAETRGEAATTEERRPLRQSGGMGEREEGQERSAPEPSAPPPAASPGRGGGGGVEERLAELQRMGFAEEDARRALALCGGDLSAAIDMLS